ncbi:hypothetical protein MRX96_051632 [Rhipicephalus microplus]|uniref:Uncharacterized protein n=1 Tax=Rhipicephalus microplus TaxID=6941 RepID=A0A9J6D2N0_RHIMP|nr:hypothetical protein HPB51_026751 [Rhipicephalus microplus]
MRLFGRKSRSFTLRPEPAGRGPELGTVPEIRVEAPPADDDDELRGRHVQQPPSSESRAACHSNGDHRVAVNDKRSTQCDDDEEDEGEGMGVKEKAPDPVSGDGEAAHAAGKPASSVGTRVLVVLKPSHPILPRPKRAVLSF